ncbi:hypothetical protein [Paractinoplanes durhamensis]|uniref:hypothetical protein n=1 Tax=Paractinoplanes durhamensis TaxID=113563 RepID=UPI00363F5EBC
MINGSLPWPEAQVVGGWWNRQFNPEIDLVGADRAPIASRLHFCGSVKWLGVPFDTHDLRRLQDGARQVPGFDSAHTGLIAVTRSGASLSPEAVDVVWNPDNVVEAWQR